MRIILLSLIKCYWYLIPPEKRDKCIFKKNCSNHVFDITKNHGFVKGLKSMHHRFKHCKSGYYVINGQKGKLLISANNQIFDENEIKERILYDL